jgi:hypothetical protein
MPIAVRGFAAFGLAFGYQFSFAAIFIDIRLVRLVFFIDMI